MPCPSSKEPTFLTFTRLSATKKRVMARNEFALSSGSFIGATTVLNQPKMAMSWKIFPVVACVTIVFQMRASDCCVCRTKVDVPHVAVIQVCAGHMKCQSSFATALQKKSSTEKSCCSQLVGLSVRSLARGNGHYCQWSLFADRQIRQFHHSRVDPKRRCTNASFG